MCHEKAFIDDKIKFKKRRSNEWDHCNYKLPMKINSHISPEPKHVFKFTLLSIY